MPSTTDYTKAPRFTCLTPGCGATIIADIVAGEQLPDGVDVDGEHFGVAWVYACPLCGAKHVSALRIVASSRIVLLADVPAPAPAATPE